MNMTTWLNEQARFVRDALAAGHLGAGLGTASRLRVGTGRTADVNPRGFDSPARHGFQASA